jgi:transposase InsO family protein
MGRVGSAFDNAMVESFFATLKEEIVYRRSWPTAASWRWRSSPASRAYTS